VIERKITTIAREEMRQAIRKELEPAIDEIRARERLHVLAAVLKVYQGMYEWRVSAWAPERFEFELLAELKREVTDGSVP